MNAITETKAATVQAHHKNIYCALTAAQSQMGTLTKGAINPAFKGEGKLKGTAYADLADVVEVIREPLNSNGVAFFHRVISGEARDMMETVFYHGESDTSISCAVPLIVDRQNMQGMKSATTYAKRIGLESLSGIAPEDDDGNAAASAAPMIERRPAPRPPAVSEDAIDAACGYLTGADDLPDLQRVWGNIPADVKAVAKVIAAKDARKAQLQQPADMAGDNAKGRAIDLGGDSIPY